MFKNNPLFLHILSVFSTYIFLLQVLCLLKALQPKCFQETQLFKNIVCKKHFFTHAKNTFFQQKRGVILGFGQFPMKPLFVQFFLVSTVLGQEKFWAKHIDAVFFSLLDTNGVRQVLLKIHVLFIFSCLKNHLKTLFLQVFLAFYHFLCFSVSLAAT